MTKPITRRTVVGTLTATAAVGALPKLHAATPDEALTFLTIGDWGRNGDSHQRDVAVQMGKTAEAVGSRFTVSVGDNIYDSGVASVDDPLWRTSFEEIYTAPALQRPWYSILGNHDYKGNPQAQIDYSRKSNRWMMPGRYYVVEGSRIGAPHVDMFMIDTAPMISGYRNEPEAKRKHHVMDQDPAAQIAWLDAALAKSKAPWKIVFGHHPVHTGGEHGDAQDLNVHLKPLLEKHGVQAYICGHDHDMQHIVRGNVHYILTGCGSAVRPVEKVEGTRFALSRSGFSLYRVGPETMTLEFVDYMGEHVYKAEIPRHA